MSLGCDGSTPPRSFAGLSDECAATVTLVVRASGYFEPTAVHESFPRGRMPCRLVSAGSIRYNVFHDSTRSTARAMGDGGCASRIGELWVDGPHGRAPGRHASGNQSPFTASLLHDSGRWGWRGGHRKGLPTSPHPMRKRRRQSRGAQSTGNRGPFRSLLRDGQRRANL
ncbi:MAG: hypothetical protein BWY17_02775 [Deltaproteobacteria bacterium ADurb.Bin207]|nr:MAG: hypothetical protein BWY17_02775 [Deltaproteobacteria bacterium ADurb.Bin207]